VTLDIGETSFAALRDHMDRTFAQLAQDKKIEFSVELDPTLPRSMYTDDKRLQQIIKNLLSNAFKFTETGHVRLRIGPAESGWSLTNPQLRKADRVLAFVVEDTGIGIPEDKQRIIFEAFQQADGTTSRKYGGTGLGLSISREITWLLGGELTVSSVPGQGSTFTLYLPLSFSSQAQPPARSATPTLRPAAVSASTLAEEVDQTVVDDRDAIEPGDPVVLIVEDDARFASILLSLARESGFKAVVAAEGGAVLPLARRFSPQMITLDIGLPDMDGLALLDLLKRNPETSHIPVHVISADEESRIGLGLGAYSFNGKPVEPSAVVAALDAAKTFRQRPKRLLAIELGDDKGLVRAQVGNGDVETRSAGDVEEAITALDAGDYDCLVLNVNGALPPELMDRLRSVRTPVVVFAPEPPNDGEEALLRQLRRANKVVKVARSAAHLVDATTLFLHRAVGGLPEEARAALQQLRRAEPELAGRKVVIIDDDIRNIFSLTSALEEHGVELHFAESGRSGIELLRRVPDADIALVDIMMPGMDGYETIREIRSIPELEGMPIVAVTAKAMKGDRQKCIEAGASDYVAKPVDMDQLVSVLRAWLHRSEQGARRCSAGPGRAAASTSASSQA
jgi:CheY-like chemotaxis protein